MATHAHKQNSSFSSVYDVFLSFRGDTRKKFTGHLYKALKEKGVNTFIDNEELRIGNEISSALLTAIKHSKISIPVFSTNYASSKWCLKEIAEIYGCYQTNDQIVLPIFLDVKPADVRNQTGSFKEAFKIHEKKYNELEINKWREALKEIGKLKGWDLEEAANGDESNLVRLVVGMVLSKLSNTLLHVAKHPIGLDVHVQYILNLLSLESEDPQFVGIWGMGGIGKTTMTKAVYNEIFKSFDGSSFLADVREHASTPMGLVSLQEKLLCDILGTQDYNISHVDKGLNILKERLRKEKVLIILDDVDNRKQVNALASELGWFGPGSRIIITTRDENVLKVSNVHDNKIYMPQGLDDVQALKLFSLHAFWADQPPKDYLKFSKEVVYYARGLPLTLEVLGCYLCDIREKEEWKSALRKLENFPAEEVQNKLKISYDGLDAEEKAIFLDVACLFIYMNKEYIIEMWEACGVQSRIGLKKLVQKSLVRINHFNKLEMHDQLRDMGRKIVYDENPMAPQERSRLWSSEEIMDVLKEHKGTTKVQGILLPSYEWDKRIDYNVKDFATMSNLRFLLVDGLNLEGNFEQLPSSIKWLSWRQCPLKIVPSSFNLEKLVVLRLSHSLIREAWNFGFQNKRFGNLKILDLSTCTYLEKSPIYSGFPLLETLILKECTSLVDVHESIGELRRLVFLDLTHCIKLTKLPLSICRLCSLKELILDHCGIQNLSDIGHLEKLETLSLEGCWSLTFLPKLPSSLIFLNTGRCSRLERLPDISNLTKLQKLWIFKCLSLAEIQGLEGLESLEDVNMIGCFSWEGTWTEVLIQVCFNDWPFSICEFQQHHWASSVREFQQHYWPFSVFEFQWSDESRSEESVRKFRQGYVIGNSAINSNESPSEESVCKFQQRYVIDNSKINKGIGLCIVFEFEEHIPGIERYMSHVIVEACIYRNGIQTTYHTDLKFAFFEGKPCRRAMFIHNFQGLNWFGIPLRDKEEIKIQKITLVERNKEKGKCFVSIQSMDILSYIENVDDFEEFFYLYLLEQMEPIMMEDFFSMPYVDEGESHPLHKEEEHAQRANKRQGEGPSLRKWILKNLGLIFLCTIILVIVSGGIYTRHLISFFSL